MRDLGEFSATCYGPPWGGINGTGTTAGGTDLHAAPHRYIVAVDPSVIPLGTRLRIEPNPFGTDQPFLADDTGGAIRSNRLDFYVWQGHDFAMAWGVRNVHVWALSGDEAQGDPENLPGTATGGSSGGGAGGPSAPAPTSSGGIASAEHRSEALRALVWVALIAGGVSLTWRGLGHALGIDAGASPLTRLAKAGAKAAPVV